MKCCENCGWLSVNPSGAMFCGYSDQRTWKDECCMAWKDKDEPQTNADRIRAMTDEELAEWLFDVSRTDGFCPIDGDIRKQCEAHNFQCVPCVTDWLKQEVCVDG